MVESVRGDITQKLAERFRTVKGVARGQAVELLQILIAFLHSQGMLHRCDVK
jgi:hypothetical protein